MIDVGRCSHLQRRRLAEDEVIRKAERSFFVSSDAQSQSYTGRKLANIYTVKLDNYKLDPHGSE